MSASGTCTADFALAPSRGIARPRRPSSSRSAKDQGRTDDSPRADKLKADPPAADLRRGQAASWPVGIAHDAQSGLSMSSCPQVGQMNGIMRFPSSRGPTPAYFDVGAFLPRAVVLETLSARPATPGCSGIGASRRSSAHSRRPSAGTWSAPRDAAAPGTCHRRWPGRRGRPRRPGRSRRPHW